MSCPTSHPTPDMLGGWEPAPRHGLRLRDTVLAGVVGTTAIAVAGTGLAFAAMLSGGGAQPEDVVPASAFAFAKLDLDPAAGQKLAVYRLAERFPSIADQVSGEDDVKDQLLAALFADAPGVDYDADLRPWVGDRVGVAAVPVAGAEPEPLVAVAYTDRQQAEAALQRLLADDPDTAYAFSPRADYVLLGQSQATVDAAATTSDVLADDDGYADALDALDGDQIATAWLDADALWQALPEQVRAQAGVQPDLTALAPRGQLVVGARVEDRHVEVAGRLLGLRTGLETPTEVGAERGTGMVQDLPEDVVGAFGVTGLGDGLAEFYEQVEAAAGEDADLSGLLGGPGLDLPGDLRALLGQETVVAAFGEQDVAARSRTADPDRARTAAESLATVFFGFGFGSGVGSDVYVENVPAPPGEPFPEGMAPQPLPPEAYLQVPPPPGLAPAPLPPDLPPAPPELPLPEQQALEAAEQEHLARLQEVELPDELFRTVDDGLVVGSSADAVERLAAGDGGLGRSERFRRAAPDADGAGTVFYLDVRRLLEVVGAEAVGEGYRDAEQLDAVGFTSVGGADGSFRLRLTVR